MPCSDTNPCAEPCTDCLPNNGCYDNCGCINPTTWDCITRPGVLAAIGVTADMTGLQVLQAINTTINNLTVDPPSPGSDVYAKVSSSDTTASYLSNKLLGSTYIDMSVINPGGNEKLKFSLSPAKLISANTGNILELGTDGKLRVVASSIPADIQVLGGTGVTVTGTGPASDPFIVSVNPAISIVRSCFDNTWRNINLVSTGNANVTYVAGTPQYRYRFDGTIEFKGSATYTVNFGAYGTGNRRFTIPLGGIPVTCLTAIEQAGITDLKGINYIDTPQASEDQITQLYGYIIRKNAQNIVVEFQSSFTNTTSKTIVVNFEGAVSYPSI